MRLNQQLFRVSANANRIDTATVPRCCGTVIFRLETAFDSTFSSSSHEAISVIPKRIILEGFIYEHDELSGREVNVWGFTKRSFAPYPVLSACALTFVYSRSLGYVQTVWCRTGSSRDA